MTEAELECGRGRPVANTAALAVAIVSAVIGGLALAPAADARYGDGVLKVLVMGDSYSAGNGAGSYEGPRGCRRSPAHDYGGTFTQLVSHPPYSQQAEVTVVACSGAKTSAFASKQGDRDPQLDAVTQDADIVFLTIGGNDLKFASIVCRRPYPRGTKRVHQVVYATPSRSTSSAAHPADFQAFRGLACRRSHARFRP